MCSKSVIIFFTQPITQTYVILFPESEEYVQTQWAKNSQSSAFLLIRLIQITVPYCKKYTPQTAFSAILPTGKGLFYVFLFLFGFYLV